ncbi:MAG: hypothetical protein ABI693_05470 [Bryobacteraceae bacterium]
MLPPGGHVPDGKLELQILDVYGDPILEQVDVSLKNQTLSDAPVLRSLDVSQTITVNGLNVFPNGRYRLEIDALSYHPVSRFIDIPPNGRRAVTITLPVNPRKVIRVAFPEYNSSVITDDARSLLQRSQKVLAFEGKSGQALYESLDDIRRAGFLNLIAKANRTRFVSKQGAPASVLSYIEELTELRGDRFFATVRPELRTETVNSVYGELFHEVSEALHTPNPGFTSARSFKTLDQYGNLQLSFSVNSDGLYAVDMDIDDAQGFDHVFQVVGNAFGGSTNPYNIHEILIAAQELDPGYRLIVREAAAGAG